MWLLAGLVPLYFICDVYIVKGYLYGLQGQHAASFAEPDFRDGSDDSIKGT